MFGQFMSGIELNKIYKIHYDLAEREKDSPSLIMI